MGPRVSVDLITNPDAAMQPSLSLRIASIFWSRKKLNTFADADDIREITRRINGGANGLADRAHLYEKARTIWG
jgi:putative chitinase